MFSPEARADQWHDREEDIIPDWIEKNLGVGLLDVPYERDQAREVIITAFIIRNMSMYQTLPPEVLANAPQVMEQLEQVARTHYQEYLDKVGDDLLYGALPEHHKQAFVQMGMHILRAFQRLLSDIFIEQEMPTFPNVSPCAVWLKEPSVFTRDMILLDTWLHEWLQGRKRILTTLGRGPALARHQYSILEHLQRQFQYAANFAEIVLRHDRGGTLSTNQRQVIPQLVAVLKYAVRFREVLCSQTGLQMVDCTPQLTKIDQLNPR